MRQTFDYFVLSDFSQSAYVSKMRLRSQALKQQNRKLSMMLKQKEEIGDILKEIDFQQLKMENSERIEKIEERNKDFFRLKTNSTVTVHILNDYKVRLSLGAPPLYTFNQMIYNW